MRKCNSDILDKQKVKKCFSFCISNLSKHHEIPSYLYDNYMTHAAYSMLCIQVLITLAG